MPPRFPIRLVDQQAGDDASHPAELVGHDLFQITLITAAAPAVDRFAAHVLDLLTQALLAEP